MAEVIGALRGAVNLDQPNFLDKVTDSRYGKTGSYVLLIPKPRLIVTASDKGRIMERLSEPRDQLQSRSLSRRLRGSAVPLTRVAYRCWVRPRWYRFPAG